MIFQDQEKPRRTRRPVHGTNKSIGAMCNFRDVDYCRLQIGDIFRILRVLSDDDFCELSKTVVCRTRMHVYYLQYVQ